MMYDRAEGFYVNYPDVHDQVIIPFSISGGQLSPLLVHLERRAAVAGIFLNMQRMPR